MFPHYSSHWSSTHRVNAIQAGINYVCVILFMLILHLFKYAYFKLFIINKKSRLCGNWTRDFLLKWKGNKFFVNSCADENILLFQFCFSARTCETSCFTYCVRWGIVSRDSTVDGNWLRASDWCYRYDAIIRSYATGENFLGGLLVRSVHPGKKFELILTVEMKTRHPVVNFRWSVIIV